MHVAVICHEFTSRFNTSLELADRLRAAGHRVTYISHADVGDRVVASGHAFRRLTGSPADPPRLGTPSPWGIVRWAGDARAARRATAADDEIERCLVEIDPDILVIDVEMHYATIATASLGIPTVLYMNWFSIFRQPDIPPPSSDLVPTGSDDDARRIRAAWRRVSFDARVRRVRRKLGREAVGDFLRPVRYGTIHYADLEAVAEARGVSLAERADRDQWLIPLTFMDLPVLSFTASEMEFPSRTHPNMRHVGPMIPDARTESQTESPTEWADFRSRWVDADTSGPIVYCSLGSVITDIDLIRRIIDVFRRRSDWNLVIGLGRTTARSSIGSVPANVVVLDWAPQLDVLRVAHAAISHGGSSSLHECVANGVPQLLFPPHDDPLDRAGNAARAEYHGLGLRGDGASDDPTKIEARLERLLTDGSFTESITRMQQVFERYRSADTAVDLLESIAASASKDSRP